VVPFDARSNKKELPFHIGSTVVMTNNNSKYEETI
jgi:hypothetical protein